MHRLLSSITHRHQPLRHALTRHITTSTAYNPTTVLVYGGNGSLGQSVVEAYKLHTDYKVISCDYTPNQHAHLNIKLNTDLYWSTQCREVLNQLAEQRIKLQSVICTAGGWAGGNVGDDTLFGNTDSQISQHIHSSLSAAHIASQLSTHFALNVFTGSSAVLHNSPGNESMIPYSVCKAAVHQLVRALSHPKNGLPMNTVTIGLAPLTLDTPMNRRVMPDADFATWTKRELIAECVVRFSLIQQAAHFVRHGVGRDVNLAAYKFSSEVNKLELTNGSIYEFITQNNATQVNVL